MEQCNLLTYGEIDGIPPRSIDLPLRPIQYTKIIHTYIHTHIHAYDIQQKMVVALTADAIEREGYRSGTTYKTNNHENREPNHTSETSD